MKKVKAWAVTYKNLICLDGICGTFQYMIFSDKQAAKDSIQPKELRKIAKIIEVEIRETKGRR